MRRSHAILALLLHVSMVSAQTMDIAAVHRIADYGKLWSVLNLFHPEMAYHRINADSLFTQNISGLLHDPSPANFKEAVQKMIKNLNDPYTGLAETTVSDDTFAKVPNRSLIRWLPDSMACVYFSPDFIKENYSDFSSTGLDELIRNLNGAKGVMMDLRECRRNEVNDYYGSAFIKRVMSRLTDHDINYSGFRSRVHYGHESQTTDMSSFYFQGWTFINTTPVHKNKLAIHVPVCLIINHFNDHLSDDIAAMQQSGIAQVIACGSLQHFENYSTYAMELADGIKVYLRTTEKLYPNGCKTFTPNIMLSQNASEDELMNSALTVLKGNGAAAVPCTALLQNIFTTEKTEGYDSISFPSAPLRLLGLIRYWSEVNYFCPNKDRILKNWDSVLYAYIPKMLQTKNELEYNLAVASLITEIHDGHGFFSSPLWKKKYAKMPALQLKYVQGKTIVYKIFNDSLKNQLAPGDEIIAIDDSPVSTLRNWFAQYIGASNEASLQRDISEYLLSGPDGTSVNISYEHNGAIKKTQLRREVTLYRYLFSDNTTKTPVWKKITDKIGYVDFGRLQVDQIGKMYQDLQATESLIIDDRSYPKGTVWTLINYLTDKPVTAAKGITMIADDPDPSVETTQTSLWQLTVNAKAVYKGKIIILVNEITQSQAEYSCMVIQAACKNTMIIGSQTAGADGDVTGIKIPGGIRTAFSGHGVHYPDGRPTQGIGIVPGITISPTIQGIKENRDELLERAISFASSGK
ncbi:MAG TPA: S41 family peptidase [Puia sp.]|nr:S41 family peptidase [Puia sp.]